MTDGACEKIDISKFKLIAGVGNYAENQACIMSAAADAYAAYAAAVAVYAVHADALAAKGAIRLEALKLLTDLCELENVSTSGEVK